MKGLLTCDNPQGCKIQKNEKAKFGQKQLQKGQKSSKGQITTMASADLSHFFQMKNHPETAEFGTDIQEAGWSCYSDFSA